MCEAPQTLIFFVTDPIARTYLASWLDDTIKNSRPLMAIDRRDRGAGCKNLISLERLMDLVIGFL